MDGVVFDVRNNTGGNLTNAMHVIDYLCPVGPIASQQNKDGTVTTLETSDASEVELPMVVLVNGNTSYAAELFATSIREFEKDASSVRAQRARVPSSAVRWLFQTARHFRIRWACC